MPPVGECVSGKVDDSEEGLHAVPGTDVSSAACAEKAADNKPNDKKARST
jgi:hypothetical protein